MKSIACIVLLSLSACAPPTATQPPLIHFLMDIAHTPELVAQLNDYQASGKLLVGQREDFQSLDDCYVFVVDKQNVFAVFHFAEGEFRCLHTGLEVSTLSADFPGTTEIWVRIW